MTLQLPVRPLLYVRFYLTRFQLGLQGVRINDYKSTLTGNIELSTRYIVGIYFRPL